jgi:hypothetical protein
MDNTQGNALEPMQLIEGEVSRNGFLVTIVWFGNDIGGDRGIPQKVQTIEQAESLIKSCASQGYGKPGLSFIEFRNKDTRKTYRFTVPPIRF